MDDGIIRNSISAHSTKHRTPIINVAKTDGTGLLFVTRDFVFVGFVVDTLVLAGASGANVVHTCAKQFTVAQHTRRFTGVGFGCNMCVYIG